MRFWAGGHGWAGSHGSGGYGEGRQAGVRRTCLTCRHALQIYSGPLTLGLVCKSSIVTFVRFPYIQVTEESCWNLTTPLVTKSLQNSEDTMHYSKLWLLQTSWDFKKMFAVAEACSKDTILTKKRF